ncbi:MAG: hypothetical protein US74_C0036G0018 [Parcubacteria group bacterium GW2011_GWA2_38_13]|nr:MAG: hypothetical protein US74_C0036G0018 [Parcubacteria group bacterium GW2011_GWA2_38_13]
MNSITYFFISLAIILAFIGAIVFMFMKWKMKKKSKLPHALSKVFLQVMLPKESSSKTQENKQSNPQSVKAQLALAEGLFNSIGGLRAERGMKAAFKGRNDHISFEIVMHGINIFSPRSNIQGCYLQFSREYIFPIKTYIKMDVDPIAAIMNGLSKINENDSATIQFIMRSAKKEWHRWGFKTAQELQKGKGTREAIGISKSGFSIYKIVNFFSSGKSKKKQLEKDVTKSHLTPMAQEVIKVLEEKTSKAGLDVNVRILVSASNEDASKLYLKNITETYNQFNYYQYGNSLRAIKPKVSELVKNYMYREYIEKEKLVLNAEEMASMFHFPSPEIETPNIKWLLAKLFRRNDRYG